MASNNPFAIEPANPLQALMYGVQGFDRARKSVSEQEIKAGRMEAMQAPQSGDPKATQSAMAKLIGAGDIPGAKAIAEFHQNSLSAQGVYGTPIYGTDPQGNPTLGAIGKQGGYKPIDTGGVRPLLPGGQFLDTGTSFVHANPRLPGGGVGGPALGSSAPMQPRSVSTESIRPPTGGVVQKDVAGKARLQKEGSELGEATANLADIDSKMPGLERVVKQLNVLSEKATFTMAGNAVDSARRQLNINPRESAVAKAQYNAIVDNQILPLLRFTFGAQFTQKEGETLKATLGDTSKSPQEKQAILNAFIEQKRRDVDALKTRVQGGAQPAGSMIGGGEQIIGGGAADPLGIR
jgi:hypothetical protein